MSVTITITSTDDKPDVKMTLNADSTDEETELGLAAMRVVRAEIKEGECERK